MSYQFPTPEPVPGYVARFSTWGDGVLGRSKKFELKRAGRLPVSTVGGQVYVHEPVDQAIARISREDAEARAQLEAAENA
jgi:hypothetical protein